MDLFSFFMMVVAISVSGALAPGPLFFANITRGIDHGIKSGLYFSVGHMIVELPLIFLLAVGLISTSNQLLISTVSGLLGGATLIGFGLLQMKSIRGNYADSNMFKGSSLSSSLMLGVTLSGLNPFFIFWWLTIGVKLIYEALALASFIGILYMFLCHIWIDYAWLTSTAYLANKGRNVIRSRIYKVLVLIFGLILIYYGVTFLMEGWKSLLSLTY